LIQSWADAFRNAPELQQIKVTYETLKQQGLYIMIDVHTTSALRLV